MIDILISILKDYGVWGLIFLALVYLVLKRVYLVLKGEFSLVFAILVLKTRQGKAVKGVKV